VRPRDERGVAQQRDSSQRHSRRLDVEDGLEEQLPGLFDERGGYSTGTLVVRKYA
jgi:hypothetical protein